MLHASMLDGGVIFPKVSVKTGTKQRLWLRIELTTLGSTEIIVVLRITLARRSQ